MILFMLLLVLYKINGLKSMEPFIVGGKPATAEYYSYSAFLCIQNAGNSFACGSSIINQNVLLSAAHCFDTEDEYSEYKIIVRAGSASKLKGAVRSASTIRVHEDYDEETVEHDIALVFLKAPLVFGTYIKRIILMKYPPKSQTATVAGWGVLNEQNYVFTDFIQRTEQRVWTRNECKRVLDKVPKGCICGGTARSSHYAAQGDSGSALVIPGYIQIGIVSHKRPEVSVSLVIYTEVAYHYDWIQYNMKKFYCSEK